MTILGGMLFVAGVVSYAVGGIWFLVVAFQESVL